MNQRILCHFELVVNEKYYQFAFQPGVVNFDDLDSALMAFKAELEVLKEKAVAAEAEAKAKAEQEAAAQPEEVAAAPVESPVEAPAESVVEESQPVSDESQPVC